MQASLLNILITSFIVVFGMSCLWYFKWQRKTEDVTFETFFVGGGRVNESMTTNNNWGLCFAFANAIWYYAFLGYNYGPWIFLLQLPWSIAVVMLSRRLHTYIQASNFGTVHGFIERQYGPSAGTVAAVATLIGYTINIGFELFYSAFLLCVGLGAPELGFITGLFLAVFVAGYCVAGGYIGNVKTDKFQNLFGLVAVTFLIAAMMPAFFAATGSWNLFATASSFPVPPWHFILGVSTFAFLFNFADMANWQSIAATRELPKQELKKVSRGLVKSACLQLFAPALLGCLLGVLLKGLKPELADDQYFNFVFAQAFGQNMLGSILLGFVLFGLLCITISSAGSYLLASMQTLAVDVVWHRRLHNASQPKDVLQNSVLRWARHNLMLLGIGSVCAFAALYFGLSKFGISGLAFQFQFVMYGVVVTLIPCLVEGLKAMKENRPPRITPSAALSSIVAGLVAVIVPFFIAATVWDLPAVEAVRARYGVTLAGDAIINLTPVFGFLVAAIVSVMFITSEKKYAFRT